MAAQIEILKKERELKELDEKKLSAMWTQRKSRFHQYRQKLEAMQAELTIYAQLRQYYNIRKLQTRIMDDIRFRCLAVNQVAQAAAPPGIDNVKWKTNSDKMRAAINLE